MDNPLLDLMRIAVRRGADSLMADFSRLDSLEITAKGPGDFVSQADRKAEAAIVEVLQAGRAEWGILGEEGTDVAGSDARYRWIIDPLDGTANFLHGLPHWCVTVALEQEGKIAAGVTYCPLRDELFQSVRGMGVTLNNKPVKMSARRNLGDAFILIDPGHCRRDPQRLETFGRYVMATEKGAGAARVMGSGALDLCYLASGRYDVMFHAGGAKPWDIAAGFLFVEETGGIITSPALGPTTHMEDTFLAGTPVMHAAFADMVGIKK